MTLFDAAILGIVEGLTEFLPVSSTGHLILATRLLALPSTEFLKTFDIAIQLGAIAAVVVVHWRSFLNVAILRRIIAGFIPTGLIGLLVYPFVKARLLDSAELVVAALFFGGIALIIFEYLHTERDDATGEVAEMHYAQALGIGLFQALAIIPGVSRSAASILGGLMLGMRRAAVVEYSFLLAVPTLGAATALDLYKSYAAVTTANLAALGVGLGTAFLVALAVITLFLRYVRTRTFIPFGIYRIVVAVVFFVVFLRA